MKRQCRCIMVSSGPDDRCSVKTKSENQICRSCKGGCVNEESSAYNKYKLARKSK